MSSADEGLSTAERVESIARQIQGAVNGVERALRREQNALTPIILESSVKEISELVDDAVGQTALVIDQTKTVREQLSAVKEKAAENSRKLEQLCEVWSNR